MAKDKVMMFFKVTGVIAGLVVTLITCGMAIGYIKSDVDHVGEQIETMSEGVRQNLQKITVISEGVAQQKGRVDAKLEGLQKGQERIETGQQRIMDVIQKWEPK